MRQNVCKLRFAAVIVIALLAFVGVLLAQPLSGHAGTLRMTYSRIWSQAPIYVGMMKGLFDTPTLKTEFIDLHASGKMAEAVLAGSADGAALSIATLIIARERGLDLKVISPTSSYKDGFGAPNALYVHKASGITTIAGLKGKQIGISSFASNLDIETRTILQNNGLDPSKDVQLLEIPVNKGVLAFMAKRLDAYYFPASFIPALKNQEVRLATMFDIKEYKGQLILNTPITMEANFIKKNRETAVEWMVQYLKALRIVTDQPKEANKLWSEFSKTPKDVAPYYLPRDGSIDPKGVQSTIDLLLRYGYIKKPQKAADAIDTDILQEANRRLGK